MYTYIHTCIYKYKYIHIYIYTYICIYIYIYRLSEPRWRQWLARVAIQNLHKYTNIFIHIYVYTYTHTHTNTYIPARLSERRCGQWFARVAHLGKILKSQFDSNLSTEYTSWPTFEKCSRCVADFRAPSHADVTQLRSAAQQHYQPCVADVGSYIYIYTYVYIYIYVYAYRYSILIC